MTNRISVDKQTLVYGLDNVALRLNAELRDHPVTFSQLLAATFAIETCVAAGIDVFGTTMRMAEGPYKPVSTADYQSACAAAGVTPVNHAGCLLIAKALEAIGDSRIRSGLVSVLSDSAAAQVEWAEQHGHSLREEIVRHCKAFTMVRQLQRLPDSPFCSV